MNYVLHLAVYMAFFAIVALSLNLVTGYLGRISLAHAGYVAIGGYTYAIASIRFGFGFVAALCLVLVVCVSTSLFLSLPSWRFKGDFFVIITMTVQALLFGLAHNWYHVGSDLGTVKNLTNGPYGVSGVARPDIFGVVFDTIGGAAVLTASAAALAALLVFRLVTSPWGRMLKCMRDDELAFAGLGKRPRLTKVQVFALSCALAGVAGMLHVSYIGYIDPSSASLDRSILFLCMVIVGGLGTIRGSIAGAAVLLLTPEVLKWLPISETIAANLRLLAYGLLLIAMMHWRPQGLLGVYRLD